MSVMTENEKPTMSETFEPVAFSNVHAGDRVQFVTANNGFDGGDDVWRTGAVVKVTAATVVVTCDTNFFGSTAVLRKYQPAWNARCVSKAVTEQPARRPFNAANVQYVDDGLIVTAVWVSDPAIDPAEALDKILYRDLPYEVVQIAEATRHFKREGAHFSGWIISRGSDYSTTPIAQKRDAIKELRDWAEGYFTR